MKILTRLNSRTKVTAALVVYIEWATITAHGSGFDMPYKDAAATARGNAFVATANNPSAIYYNPAGITQLDSHQVRAGVYAMFPNDFGRNVIVDPALFYTWSAADFPLAFGIGAYQPYGFDSWGGRLAIGALAPTVAWRIHETFSVALTPTFNYGDLELGPNAEFVLDGFGVGVNTAALWKPHPKHSFGAVYRSSTEVEFEGHLESEPTPGFPPAPDFGDSRKASTEVTFPQSIAGGYSFRPTPAWNMEINVEWTDWNQTEPFAIEIEDLGITSRAQDWESGFTYRFGLTRYLNHGFELSAGYLFAESPIPDKSFSWFVPESDLHGVSAGFGQRIGGLHWSFAYQYLSGSDRTIANAVAAAFGWQF